MNDDLRALMTDLRWTQDRLRNWGRWSRTSRAVARCFSLEGRYRPERLTEAEEQERGRVRLECDVLDAQVVWRAVMPQRGMPIAFAFALHGVYAQRFRGDSLRAWLNKHGTAVRGRDLDALVHQAELAAAARLGRLDRREQAGV